MQPLWEVRVMRMCNDVITVFNARVDPATRGDVWRATIIRGVSWHAAADCAVEAGGGLAPAGGSVIRIPVEADAGGSVYADPVAYAAGEAEGRWTLRGGDIVAKGEFSGDDWTPAKLRQACADCVTVVGVTDNRRAPHGGHWRVTGEF